MPRVFISYRRDDSGAEAGRVADFLRETLDHDDVFFDLETIHGGDDFVNAIEGAVGRCDVFVAVIGKTWVSITGANGKPRLQDEKDFVRLEVASALKRNIRVIPVLVNGASVPNTADLPPELTDLTRRNCLEIRDLHFRQDAETLLETIAGNRGVAVRTMLRQPAAWLAAGILLSGLGFVFWKRHQPVVVPGPQPQFHLQAQVQLSNEFGRVDQAPAMKLAHRLPVDNGVNLLESAKPLGGPVYEYESPVAMPTSGQRYLGLMHRLVDSAFQTKPDWTTVCFERKADKNSREPIVRVSCQEGAACSIAADDFGWAKACAPQTGGAAWDWFGLRPVYASSDAPPAKAEEGWVVPSLDTLRKKEGSGRSVAYTEFALKSGPVPALQAADHVTFDVHVNGARIYIDGLPPETNSVKFDAGKGLDLQFGLENLDFSGVQGGYESIQIALVFLSKGQAVRRANVELRYVALRAMPEGPVGGEPDLHITWRAAYHAGTVDDLYQIFTLSTPEAKLAQELKSKVDAAHMQAAGLPLVAILRPPLGANRQYGIALGLRQPNGQVKFTFDEAKSADVCRDVWKLADHNRLIDKGVFRRSVANRGDSELCSSFGVAGRSR